METDPSPSACFEDPALGVQVECLQLAPGLGAVCGPCPAEHGLAGDGTVCAPSSPCAANPCFVGADGSAATCSDAAAPATGHVCGPCPRGYEADGEGSCRDIDECAAVGAGADACGPRAMCGNAPGTFNCTALPRDLSIISCADANGGCDPLAECCEGAFDPSGSCVPNLGVLPDCGPCPAGFEGEGAGFCEDIDGCRAEPCFQDPAAPGVRAECTDVPAGCFAVDPEGQEACPPSPLPEFTCGPCPVGFRGDGLACEACELALEIVASTAAAADGAAAGSGVIRRSEDVKIIAALGSQAEGCNATGGVQFTWTVVSDDDPLFALPAGVNTRTRDLFVPARSLPLGAYTAHLRACLSGNGRVCASVGPVALTVAATPLVGAIGGGGVSLAEANTISLDSFSVVDPDDPENLQGEWLYIWECTAAAPASATFDQPCVAPSGALAPFFEEGLGARRSTAAESIASLVTQLKGEPGGKAHLVALTAIKGPRQVTLEAPVVVFPGGGPVIKVTPLPDGGAVNPGARVVVTAAVTSNSTGLSTAWSAFLGGEEATIDGAEVTQSPIPGGVLTSLVATLPAPPEGAGTSAWSFVLVAGDAQGTGMGQADATVTAPPRALPGAAVGVAGAAGGAAAPEVVAGETADLTVDVASWSTPRPPLTYLWAARVVGGGGIPAPLTSYSPSPSAAAFLPPGLPEYGNLVEVSCWAKDKGGLEGQGPAVNVTVTLPDLAALPGGAEAWAAAALADADALLASGGPEAALQLVSVALAALPSSGAGIEAPVASPEAVASALSVLAKASALAPPSAESAVALSGVLSSALAMGPPPAAAVEEAGAAVAGMLSSLPPGSLTPAVLGSVVGALGGLSEAAAQLPPAQLPAAPPPPAASPAEYAALDAAAQVLANAEASKAEAEAAAVSAAPLASKIAIGQAEAAVGAAEDALSTARAAAAADPSPANVAAAEDAAVALAAAREDEEAAVAAAIAIGSESIEEGLQKLLAGADAIIAEAAAKLEAANATVAAAEAKEPPPPLPDPTAQGQAAVHSALEQLASSLKQQAANLPPGVGSVEVSGAGFSLSVTSTALAADGSSPLFGGPPLVSGGVDIAVPAGVLDGVDPALFGGSVVAELLVSSFDPHAAASAASPSVLVSPVVSFSLFGGGGEALPISNLAKPLYFDIPIGEEGADGGGGDGLVASCVFFDVASGEYATEGCTGMPNPVPQGCKLSWKEGFTVDWSPSTDEFGIAFNESTAAKLGKGWEISHPWLLDNCEESYDPWNGFRLFENRGGTCQLSRPDNYLGCWWDFETQGFKGSKCVLRPKQRCMCTHLTDFAADYGPPKIKVASLSEMALSPSDILKIWKMALVVVAIVLVGAAGVCYTSHSSARTKRRDVERAKSDPAHMFREVEGAWTWPFYQVYKDGRKPGQLISVEGPGPSIAVKLGVKYNRVRQAVPFGLVRGVKVEASGVPEVGGGAGLDLMSIQHQHQDRVQKSLDTALAKTGRALLAGRKEMEEKAEMSKARAEYSNLTTSKQRKELRAVMKKTLFIPEGPGGSLDHTIGLDVGGGRAPLARTSTGMGALAGMGRPPPLTRTITGMGTPHRPPQPRTQSGMGASPAPRAPPMSRVAMARAANNKRLAVPPPPPSPAPPPAPPPQGAVVENTGSPKKGTGMFNRAFGTVAAHVHHDMAVHPAPSDAPADPTDLVRSKPEARMSIADVISAKNAASIIRRKAATRYGREQPNLSAGFTGEEWQDRMVGTALVLANMGVRKIISSKELRARTAAACSLFGGMTISHECPIMFPDLLEIFRTQLALNQASRTGWYKRAQIFQLIMLQDLDGAYDADDDLATAIFARGRVSKDDKTTSNPKLFSAEEIMRSAPPALLEGAAGGRLNGEDPSKVWATLLAMAVMEGEGYDWDITATFGIVEKVVGTDSIVRRSHRYLRYAFGLEWRVEEVGELRRLAAEAAEKFETRQSVAIRYAVGPVIRAKSHPAAHVPLHKRVWKTTKVIANAMLSLHTVARCFTAPLYHAFTRRARVWVLTNYWIGALCVSVWLQAERSVQCCLMASAYIGCGWIPTAGDECVGTGAIHGSCSALFSDPALTANATAAAAAAIKRGAEFDGTYFSCGAFPDPTVTAHKVIMILLMILIPVPVKVILRFFFESGNAAFNSPSWTVRSSWESLNLWIDTKVFKMPKPWETGAIMRQAQGLAPGSEELASYIANARDVMAKRKANRKEWDDAPPPRHPGAAGGGAGAALASGGSESFVLYGGAGSVLLPVGSELAAEVEGGHNAAANVLPGLSVAHPAPPIPTHYLAGVGGAGMLVPSPAPAFLQGPTLRHVRAGPRNPLDRTRSDVVTQRDHLDFVLRGDSPGGVGARLAPVRTSTGIPGSARASLAAPDHFLSPAAPRPVDIDVVEHMALGGSRTGEGLPPEEPPAPAAQGAGAVVEAACHEGAPGGHEDAVKCHEGAPGGHEDAVKWLDPVAARAGQGHFPPPKPEAATLHWISPRPFKHDIEFSVTRQLSWSTNVSDVELEGVGMPTEGCGEPARGGAPMWAAGHGRRGAGGLPACGWLEPGGWGDAPPGAGSVAVHEARSAEVKKRQAERAERAGGGEGKAPGLRASAAGAFGRIRGFSAMGEVKSALRATKKMQELLGEQLGEMSDVDAIASSLHIKQMALSLNREELEEKKRAVRARTGWIMSTLSMMIFVYMIYVYGVKMYTNIGKGAELDFLIEYIWFMVLDNMVYSWGTVLSKVCGAMTIMALIKEFMLHHGNPFHWFEAQDDGALSKSLSDDLQAMDDIDLGLGD